MALDRKDVLARVLHVTFQPRPRLRLKIVRTFLLWSSTLLELQASTVMGMHQRPLHGGTFYAPLALEPNALMAPEDASETTLRLYVTPQASRLSGRAGNRFHALFLRVK